jgi:hypothetical protein
MKTKLTLFLSLFIPLIISCKKDSNTNAGRMQLHEQIDGFYKITSATATSVEDINGDGRSDINMIAEIPDLALSTLDIVVNSKAVSYLLLWPEQSSNSNLPGKFSYNLQGSIFEFEFKDDTGTVRPTYHDNQLNGVLSPPVEMQLVNDGVIRCKMVREITTTTGKHDVTIEAIYQLDKGIVRDYQ